MNTALLITTTPNRQAVLSQALEAAGWLVTIATTPRTALECLRQQQLCAVFCDDQLRGASPPGFLTWTQRLQPEARFYQFGAADTWRSAGSALPAAFLSYPPIPAELPLPAGKQPTPSQLDDADNMPLSGNTGLISLPQLLEFLSISRRDAVISLHGGHGQVFVKGATVLHASHQAAGVLSTGLNAMAELISLQDSDFVVQEFTQPARATVNLPVAGAVTEAARQADERRRDRAVVRQVLQLEPALLAIAVGYHLASAPSDGHGDANRLFLTAVALLNSNRTQLGAPVRSVSLTGDNLSLAVQLYGQGRLAALAARGNRGAQLLQLLESVTGSQD
jgi:CheY-like chemotaxis protein